MLYAFLHRLDSAAAHLFARAFAVTFVLVVII
jgi:hypothetical protein